MTDTTIVMPAFVFERSRHVELEAGFVLAGQLIVDIPKGKLKGRHKRIVQGIIQRLTTEARSGRMPTDALVFGWHGAAKLAKEGLARPPNAVDTSNDEIMSAWAARSIVCAVRVDPRNDGLMRFDSDVLRQMGLPKHDA
jgi:hypothetical protein